MADLKSACAEHEEQASRVQGWARSRFEQCHSYFKVVTLQDTNGRYLGKFDFELWVLAFAYDGSRRVDYVVSVENVHQGTTLRDDLTYLSINLDCVGDHVTCSGQLSRSDTIEGWYNQPRMDTVTVTSPKDMGDGPFATVDFTETIGWLAEYRDGKTIPESSDAQAINRVRFDSARSMLGSGKYHGTVFSDKAPTFTLHRSGEGNDEESRHVDDALHHPERTFPTTVGKNVPGSTDPLHRLMDQEKKLRNHAAAKKICREIWGDGYSAGGMDCDEYPFQSTYEGAAVSTGNEPFGWHGSARPIPADDNQRGGRLLLQFYGTNRVLDSDSFHVRVEG
ncbi:NucA/NucB deoxyribonuclease domain-containing protein [Saccharomonospora iraqiensis]|uniref:NucA/NucB deoxyribonuclease domain-containing protein n=1 Tax=Saccharomonospora iraqiensis TaxID=52698 RepID=UPI001F328E98|nr:NucA/NucB deoxyribonuclease domain-containing protein [Saccharomonospora iraqiensis]